MCPRCHHRNHYREIRCSINWCTCLDGTQKANDHMSATNDYEKEIPHRELRVHKSAPDGLGDAPMPFRLFDP